MAWICWMAVAFGWSDPGAALPDFERLWKPKRDPESQFGLWCPHADRDGMRVRRVSDFKERRRKSLEIRTSELPVEIKAKQLAALIKPGMSIEQVHVLLGESKALIPEIGRSWVCRTLDLHYGLAISLNAEGNVLNVEARTDKCPTAAWEIGTRVDVVEPEPFRFGNNWRSR